MAAWAAIQAARTSAAGTATGETTAIKGPDACVSRRLKFSATPLRVRRPRAMSPTRRSSSPVEKVPPAVMFPKIDEAITSGVAVACAATVASSAMRVRADIWARSSPVTPNRAMRRNSSETAVRAARQSVPLARALMHSGAPVR